MRKTFAIVFTAAVLAGVLGENAAGQSQSKCPLFFDRCAQACGTAPAGNCFAPAVLPRSAVDLGPDAPFCRSFWIAGACHPHQPRCNHCSGSPIPKATGGSPIDLATGNTYVTQTDISLPGLGGGLSLSRIWNSIPSASYPAGVHMFGLNWQSTYEDRLIFQSSGDGLMVEEDGGDDETAFGFDSFGPNTYSVVTPSNKTGTLTTNVDANNNETSWTLVLKNGEKRVYDPNTGFLLSISDRNGNTTTLTYDASNRLTTVTDAVSRHLYFDYASSTSNLVTKVRTDVGITLSYTYDGNGRLTQVTKPDNTTVSFTYDGKNMLTSVLDNEGKVLESHTYDGSGHGLTSTRANGVDSVKVSY